MGCFWLLPIGGTIIVQFIVLFGILVGNYTSNAFVKDPKVIRRQWVVVTSTFWNLFFSTYTFGQVFPYSSLVRLFQFSLQTLIFALFCFYSKDSKAKTFQVIPSTIFRLFRILAYFTTNIKHISSLIAIYQNAMRNKHFVVALVCIFLILCFFLCKSHP